MNIEISYMAVPGIAIDKYLPLEYIERKVCYHFNITGDTIRIRSRKREIVVARQIAMKIAAEKSNKTLSIIGNYFGGYDHATVLHAKKTVKNLNDSDREYRQKLTEIEQSLNN